METNVTLQQLVYLVALDRCGSFVDAAAACKVSQPALSMQIRKLENSLGVKLFDRSRQPIQSTAVGRRLIGQARLTLREAGRIQELVDLDKGEMTGTYRLGVLTSVASAMISQACAGFLADYPGVSLAVQEATSADLVDALRRDRIDAALMILPSGPDTLEDRPLYREPIVTLVPREHPLYKKEVIEPGDLADEPVLPHDRDEMIGAEAIQMLGITTDRGNNPAARVVWSGGGPAAQRRIVEAGLAIALLPGPIADEMRSGGVADMIREFVPPVPTRSIGIVSPPSGRRQHMTDAFVAILSRLLPGDDGD